MECLCIWTCMRKKRLRHCIIEGQKGTHNLLGRKGMFCHLILLLSKIKILAKLLHFELTSTHGFFWT